MFNLIPEYRQFFSKNANFVFVSFFFLLKKGEIFASRFELTAFEAPIFTTDFQINHYHDNKLVNK